MKRELSTHAAAAKAIRTEIKKHGINARVTASTGSMTSSVRVRILDDVLPATKKAIEDFANRYQYGHFDGMTDCYEYSNRDDKIPQVKFVFVEVAYSDEIKAAARDYIESIKGIPSHDIDGYVHRALMGSWGDFWTGRKPKVKLAA